MSRHGAARDLAADLDLLRDWMIHNYGGLPDPDRSTASYALEFLKTEKANRELAYKRADSAEAALEKLRAKSQELEAGVL